MKNARLFPSFLVAAALAFVFFSSARARTTDNETSTIKFSDPSKPGTLKISLANGDVRIRGTDAAEIGVTSDLQPEEAPQRKDGLRVLTSSTSFSLTEEKNVVRLTYGLNGWPMGGNSDFVITVPHQTNIVLTSSYGGETTIANVTGDIEIKSLNGEVKLSDVTGAALVETMNGEISCTVKELRDNKPLSFTSMNGEVLLKLPSAAKANVRLRTHNGSILTDFDDQSLVTKTESVRSGKKDRRTPRTTDYGTGNDTDNAEIREAMREAVRAGAEAAREAASALREAARAAHEAARAENEDSEDPVAPVAPVPPVPPLPPMTGGKIVTGTLNGGGPEIRITTMNGDVTLRKIEAK